MINSKRLEKLLDACDLDDFMCSDLFDSTCTAGYNNDGSTTYEIFQNGFELAVLADGNDIVQSENWNIVFFFIGDEEEICQKVDEHFKEAYGEEEWKQRCQSTKS